MSILSTTEQTLLMSIANNQCVVFEPNNYANDGYTVFVCEEDNSETGVQMDTTAANEFAETLTERGLTKAV